ncbi:MAG: polysaccharide biosynthesis C-terminal domain-containing protein, partial [Dorea sp.]
IAIPAAVGIGVLAKPILDLLFYTENNETGALMLQLGALSVVFYCLSTVTNAVLQGLDDMMTPVKSAAISLVIHVVALFIMMVVFKWGIYAVVLSKIVFSASACILNSHALRERIGYVQEKKRTFIIPAIASVIMGVVTLGVRLLVVLFIGERIATIIALCVAVAVYAVSLVLLGGVTESEMIQMPKGRLLVNICKKVRLFK